MKNRDLFQQDISLLIKSGLCKRKDYIAGYALAVQALERIKIKADQGEMSFLKGPFLPQSDLNRLQDNFKGMRMILIVGNANTMSSLRALSGILQSWIWVDGARPRLCFLDMLDPEIFWEIMSVANPATTGVIVLSQSGENEPTLLQLMRCLEYWHGLMAVDEIARHFLVITRPCSSRLMRIVDRWQLPHWRYPDVALPPLSCFAPPLLAPLGLAGFDRTRFNHGAGSTCVQFFQGRLKAPLEMAAALFAGNSTRPIHTHRLWGEGLIFQSITDWMQNSFAQIATNSPYRCVSGFDNAPEARVSTVFFERHVARERLVPDFWKDLPQLKTLAQTPMLHWVKDRHEKICQNALDQGHFVRQIHVHNLNEETLGALFMNHVLESLLIQELYA
jgi:hypothetical protein